MKTYFKGDLAEFTGKTEKLYGGIFQEVVLLEGHLVGKTRLVKVDAIQIEDDTPVGGAYGGGCQEDYR